MAYLFGLAALSLLDPIAASNVEMSLSKLGVANTISNTITLTPPRCAAKGRQVVDGAYQSFSIEFAYMVDYGGNNTYHIS